MTGSSPRVAAWRAQRRIVEGERRVLAALDGAPPGTTALRGAPFM